MSQAREQILSTIRKALGRGALPSQARTQLDARLMTPPAHTRPGFTEELVPRFIAKLKAAYATLDQVAKLDDVGGAVLAYLESQQLPKRLLASPALQSLPWPAGIEVGFGATRGEDPVSVTPCFAAVAETGSLVLLSGPESPTTLNFLPDDHIIIVQTHQIVRHIEDVWTRLHKRPEGIPRTINFITGPSRTADVEQTIQLGAHGPRRLHVILVET
jgi:L-lactate dehydrogenase complex protein LldG